MSSNANDNEHEPSANADAEMGYYEVAAILDKRVFRGRIEYLISWKDYAPDLNSWEPASNLGDARQIVHAYNKSNPTRQRANAMTESASKLHNDNESSKTKTPSSDERHEGASVTRAKNAVPNSEDSRSAAKRGSKKKRKRHDTSDPNPSADDDDKAAAIRRSIVKPKRTTEQTNKRRRSHHSDARDKPEMSDESKKLLERLRLHGTTSGPPLPPAHRQVIKPGMELIGIMDVVQGDHELMFDVGVRVADDDDGEEVKQIRVPVTEMAAHGGRASQLALTYMFHDMDTDIRMD